jgi:hypothetical protein
MKGDLQSQSQRNATPKPIKLPPQPKSRPKRNRHRDNIITEQIHPSSNLLPSETSEQTITVRCQSIEELECSAEGKNRGDEVDDTLVVGEELGNVAPEGREEDDVEDSDDCGSEHCLYLVSG